MFVPVELGCPFVEGRQLLVQEPEKRKILATDTEVSGSIPGATRFSE